MDKDIKIIWSNHFHERLMERFGVTTSKEEEQEIEEMIRNDEIFCTILHEENIVNAYGMVISGQDVMVMTKSFSKYSVTVMTAYRRTWFIEEDGVWMWARDKIERPLSKTKKRTPLLKEKINKYKYQEFQEIYF